MRDLSRNANARHQPATAGVDEEFFRDYAPGQRVMTPEGIPGTIVAVEDGPFLNMESYEVVLDDGLGGGSYGTHELVLIPGNEAARHGAQVAEVVVPTPVDDPNLHMASEDYPELAEILVERPPLAHAEPLRMSASKTASNQEWDPMMGEGDVVTTPSGRQTTPFPRVDTSTERRTTLTLARIRDWMHENAKIEIAAQGLIDTMPSDPKQMAPADFDTASMVIFGSKTAAVPLKCGDCGQTYFTDGEPHGCTEGALVSEGYYTEDELRALAASVQASDEALFERDEIDQEMAPAPTPEIPIDEQEGPFFATAGLWDHVMAPIVDKATEHIDARYPGIETGTTWSYDWCRFRRERHCFFPKEMDLKATQEAGYAVWIPLDRGICGRDKWEHQKMCPVAEPGPKSGDPAGRLDATVSWEDGGQRGGVWASKNEPDHVFEFLAAWSDVRDKARQIKGSGGVRVISIAGDKETGRVVTAEVKGDSHVYETSIQSEPGRTNVALWTCACPWAAYSWGRSGRWKKYEGRMCSHALALTYAASTKNLMENPDASWGADEVQRPGDYVPPAKTASVDPSWHPVETDGYLAVAPAVHIAHSMLAEGQRDQEVVLAFGPEIHAIAKTLDFKGRLQALVNGVVKTVKEIVAETGRAILTDGSTVSVRDLSYPTYHPSLGLVASLNDDGEDDTGEEYKTPREYPTTSHGDTGEDSDYDEPAGDMGDCEICGRPADWYYGGATRCTTHRGVEVAASHEALLQDEPEAALPQAFGEEEDEDADGDADGPERPEGDDEGSSDEDVPADRVQAHLALSPATGSVQTPASVSGGLEWLMAPGGSGGAAGASSGHGDADIAAHASEVLAKMAVRTFSRAEQEEIIGEGEDVLAANLNALDLEGTHYAGLEEVFAAEDVEEWLS